MKQSGFGIASLILGIVGLVFSCFIVGIIPAFLGLILQSLLFAKRIRKRNGDCRSYMFHYRHCLFCYYNSSWHRRIWKHQSDCTYK